MTVAVSVDLAFRRYANVGIAVLVDQGDRVTVEFPKAADLGLADPPDPCVLALRLRKLCEERGASILLLDGPQAWKDPDNGLMHQRVCEKALNTPAKTGPPGQVKPAPYTPFVEFCVAVFDALREAGGRLLLSENVALDATSVLVLESFPTAAWVSLGLPKLLGKAKTKPDHLQACYQRLCAQHRLEVNGQPNHDELQALVAGLAGVAIGRGAIGEYRVVGAPPIVIGEIWREGFIVIPRK